MSVEISIKGSMFRVRDSKNKSGEVVTLPGWDTFLAAIKRGQFSRVH
ncbi:DUF397 domain-containing protein [Lentzea tibetensis]|uniref:DUF397 domain-containing protein n=1 Tax=Lentzea tibetensis TaxID=2591470 RepID=A0A563EZ46_9PSEU|nr:DUF397 domain-containing protein [Lentzea tibetensis]TWP52798.1 DUF397 domain-containing protein [Lentzea tibetensis]